MYRCSSTRRVHQIIVMLLGILLVWRCAGNAQTPVRFSEIFDNLTWRPAEFAELLSGATLVKNVHEAVDGLPSRLPDASLRAIERKPGDLLRIGSKQVPVADAAWWLHFEGGRPVVTAVGNIPELRASGLTPGMELVAIDGKPVDEVLKRDIYPVVSASTPQGRDFVAFYRILEGEPDTTLSATFLDLQGNKRTFDLKRDLAKHQDAFQSRPLIEFRDLPGGIVYVALNSFGNAKLPARFDQYFGRILDSKGLIIDVRHNQGGSFSNGYAVIARLIADPTTQTSAERTHVYKPAERARGKAEEWYEYPRDRIEPRGDKPYLGPVVVLTGPETFSAAEDFLVPLKSMKRATLIGMPTAGSTGQPLTVPLYGTNIRICTKWDRFADGTEFVGVGVQPDILVEPTRGDIAAGRDSVLDRAVAFLLNGAKR